MNIDVPSSFLHTRYCGYDNCLQFELYHDMYIVCVIEHQI